MEKEGKKLVQGSRTISFYVEKEELTMIQLPDPQPISRTLVEGELKSIFLDKVSGIFLIVVLIKKKKLKNHTYDWFLNFSISLLP